MRNGLLACAVALAVLLGAGGGEAAAADLPKPLAGRFETPSYVFTVRAREPVKKIKLGSKRLRGGKSWLVVVRVRMRNLRHGRLKLGQLSAALEDRAGRSFAPVFADGRELTDPLFAKPAIRPRKALNALVVFRLPRASLEGADLQLRDPERGHSFELSVL